MAPVFKEIMGLASEVGVITPGYEGKRSGFVKSLEDKIGLKKYVSKIPGMEETDKYASKIGIDVYSSNPMSWLGGTLSKLPGQGDIKPYLEQANIYSDYYTDLEAEAELAQTNQYSSQ